MCENTNIEWCDHTWSPWRGCTKISPGCANCYAETLSKRNPAVLGQWGKGAPRVLAKNWGDPVKWNREENSRMVSHDEFVAARKPTVFPSLCDWLDEEVPIEWLARLLKLIRETPNLDWLLLTKRPENWEPRLRAVCVYLQSTVDRHVDHPAWSLCNRWLPWNGTNRFNPPTNIWIGTSVEDQPRANERIPALLSIPAKVRFLSVEPLLKPVSLGLSSDVRCRHCGFYVGGHASDCRINWVIVGGESGPHSRPCNVDWIRSIVKQCKEAGVPCFVKQLGAVAFEGRFEGKADPASFDRCERLNLTHPKGGDPAEWPLDLRVRQFPEVKP